MEYAATAHIFRAFMSLLRCVLVRLRSWIGIGIGIFVILFKVLSLMIFFSSDHYGLGRMIPGLLFLEAPLEGLET